MLAVGRVALCGAVSATIYASSRKSRKQKKEISKRLGRPPINTNPYEDLLIQDAVNPVHIDVGLESIGGLANIKKQLYELVILPLNPDHVDFEVESVEGFENIKPKLKRPDLSSPEKLIVGPVKGVLLYGPPGTGKTMLAQAIAKESGAVFINVKVSNLMSKVLGDSQKRVTALFTLARKLQPSIIFIDELDDFLGKRKSFDPEVMTNMKNQFMSMWSGFKTDQNTRVMILAVTNRPLFELDEFTRSKFYHTFEIKIPNRKERATILRVTLKGERVDDNIDYDYLAGLCEGSTSSDLVDLCNKAAYLSLMNHLVNAENENAIQARRPLAQADLEKAFCEYKKTATAAQEYSRRASQ